MPLVILMYHDIIPSSAFNEAKQSIYTITGETFSEHIDEIKKAKLRVYGMDELTTLLKENRLPDEGVVLSFDDGFEGNYRFAFPLLKQMEWSGTFFIVSQLIDQPDHISRQGLIEMNKNGMIIASHTQTHRRLDSLAEPEISEELNKSKEILEEIVGKEVHHLSLPGGGIAADLAIIAKDSGYQTVANSVPAVVTNQTELYGIPRLAIRHNQTIDDFRLMIRGEKGWLSRAKQKYLLKNAIKSILPSWLTAFRHHAG